MCLIMKRRNFCFISFLLLPLLFINCDDDAAMPYRSYSSLISQEDTHDPTEKLLINELGFSIEWTRKASGAFKGVLSKPVDLDKTSLIIQLSESDRIATGGFINSTTIEFYTLDRFNVYDSRDGISNAVLEIKTYN